MKRRELANHLATLAEPLYSLEESKQIARMILEEVGGVSFTQLVVDPDRECEIQIEELTRIEHEIAIGRPIQYIIGESDFCGLRLKVREGVLIPRPESEELISWIVSGAAGGERVLDIGTGSGALAIAISSKLPEAEVLAIDISKEALEVARENGALLNSDVRFLEGDALAGVENYVDGEFDIIVSNPPYIPRCEGAEMRKNVVDFEPHLALFVPDHDPLLFYREIAKSAKKRLKKGGLLYYEIHENFADECVQMLREMAFVEVELRNDINDKARMVCAKRR